MSISPAQNFSKPPLVPEAPTVTLTSGFSSLKSSVPASANGWTVLEPSMEIDPERSPPPEPLLPLSSSPHAATPSARRPLRPAAKTHLLLLTDFSFVIRFTTETACARGAPCYEVVFAS
jgi:hypothetical protein